MLLAATCQSVLQQAIARWKQVKFTGMLCTVKKNIKFFLCLGKWEKISCSTRILSPVCAKHWFFLASLILRPAVIQAVLPMRCLLNRNVIGSRKKHLSLMHNGSSCNADRWYMAAVRRTWRLLDMARGWVVGYGQIAMLPSNYCFITLGIYARMKNICYFVHILCIFCVLQLRSPALFITMVTLSTINF